MSDTDLTADDLALIDEPHLGFVATVMADGTPQITPVWVDSDGHDLRFNTARGRVKTNNLERDPSVAVLGDRRERPVSLGRASAAPPS